MDSQEPMESVSEPSVSLPRLKKLNDQEIYNLKKRMYMPHTTKHLIRTRTAQSERTCLVEALLKDYCTRPDPRDPEKTEFVWLLPTTMVPFEPRNLKFLIPGIDPYQNWLLYLFACDKVGLYTQIFREHLDPMKKLVHHYFLMTTNGKFWEYTSSPVDLDHHDSFSLYIAQVWGVLCQMTNDLSCRATYSGIRLIEGMINGFLRHDANHPAIPALKKVLATLICGHSTDTLLCISRESDELTAVHKTTEALRQSLCLNQTLVEWLVMNRAHEIDSRVNIPRTLWDTRGLPPDDVMKLFLQVNPCPILTARPSIRPTETEKLNFKEIEDRAMFKKWVTRQELRNSKTEDTSVTVQVDELTSTEEKKEVMHVPVRSPVNVIVDFEIDFSVLPLATDDEESSKKIWKETIQEVIDIGLKRLLDFKVLNPIVKQKGSKYAEQLPKGADAARIQEEMQRRDMDEQNYEDAKLLIDLHETGVSTFAEEELDRLNGLIQKKKENDSLTELFSQTSSTDKDVEDFIIELEKVANGLST